MPAKKEPVGLVCIECGADFSVQPYRARTAKTCSIPCRQKHNGRFSGESKRHSGNGKRYTKWHQRHMHRVAMEKKLGRELRAGEIVHHIDGNMFNNEASNLLLTTRAEHCELHGFGRVINPNRKLTEQQILEIRASKQTNKALALRFGVDPNTIRTIRLRRTWRHVP